MAFTLPIWRRSLCAASGAICGGLAGMVMGFYQGPPGAVVLTAAQAFQTGLVLGFIGWMVLLLVIGAWLHYTASAIALPALVNALLSSVLTVFICNALNIPIIDVLVGLLIGTLVGWLLCLLCGRWAEPGLKGVAR
jgi:hypothetical protein